MNRGVKRKLLFGCYIGPTREGRRVGLGDSLATAGRGRGESARFVVLESFGEPTLDLPDPGRIRRVGREELRLARALLLAHAHPEVTSGVGVVSRLRHQDEP